MSFKADRSVSVFLREPNDMFAEMKLSLCFRSSLIRICLLVVFCI